MPFARTPITVAHVTGEMAFSGGEAQVFLLLDGLRKRGHRSVLLCPPGSRSESEARRRGIDSHPIRVRNEWSPRNVWGIRRRLIEAKPDLVHLHTGRANWLGGLAAWQLGLPAVTTRRMDRPVKRNLRTRFVYGRAVRRAAVISRVVERRLLDAGVPERMIRLIPSAVDPDALHPQRTRHATREAEGLDEASPCLLVVAALIPRKGVDVLVEALARVEGAVPEPVLWIAGEGPERGALERRVAQRGLAPRVRFLGQRCDVPDLLAACDVFALPSRQEGLGVAALEAMALGRPVVASDVGGLREAVDHDVTGLRVPPDDPAALARAIERLLADASLRRELGRRGPERVAALYRCDRMVESYEHLYAEVLREVERS